MRLHFFLLLGLVAAFRPLPAAAQACPAGRSCFYVPPALPQPPGYSVDWDMVLASPRGTITGTWRAGAGAPTAFTVTPGAPLVVPLSATEGTAGAYGVAESRGIFIEASSQELLVDHRLIVGPWQSSSTIKSSAFALGTRFRLAGYVLNAAASADTGFDYAAVYAPFGGTVTFEAPAGAPLPFWQASAAATFSVTLAPGQTYLARTVPGATCTRDLDGALVTSSEPITVDTGGRGWDGVCGVSGGCGDDGADNVLPTSGLGTEFVVLDYPTAAANGEELLVVADTAGTQVAINGVLVATLPAGGSQSFPITGTTYVETSQRAYVYETSGLSGCEVDIALIPPLALAPVGAWVVDLNVPAGLTAQIGVVLATGSLASVRVDGVAPTFVAGSVGTVPGHPELTAARVAVTAGNHSVRADTDFQLGLVTGGGGTGLFGYYTPFRIPGCGDGVRVAGEACDDGDLDDGDGCSSTCKLETGQTGCVASSDCVPAARCDAGTCVARCFASAECNDSNACTVDSCDASGACANAPVAAGAAGACTGGLVCSGAPRNECVACADDTTCSGATPRCDVATNTCVGCLAAADCDDGSTCTVDACSANSCVATPVADGTACATGLCASGACVVACGDGVVAMGVETCDDGNTIAMDGCSATCAVETGWSCGCSAPTVTYSMEMLAGRVGGDGGGVGPQQGCAGADVLIGLAIDWSDARGEAVRTTTICGSVGVSAGGVVTTTPTTREEQGGSGCSGWDPSTASAEITCPVGWAIVGITGRQSLLGGTPTLFDDLSIVCQALAPDGSAAGPTMTLNVPGGGAVGPVMQEVACPAGHIARFFQTRSGCGQDALDLFCGVASADCGGSASVCGTFCGDGAVGAPAEACDDAGESPTCDADCTLATCGDGTVNAAAAEDCDDSGESAACDDDCTAATCGDGTVNPIAAESCDDGNTTGGDGCSATCVSESCGDGMVQGTEQCDDAGESAACDPDCTSAVCGDGTLNASASETCDDAGESAACDDDCTAPSCGDGNANAAAGEACDDAGESAGCDADCSAASCGDGTLNATAGEDCDDGNTDAGDGCSPTCAEEVATDAGAPDAGARDGGGIAVDAGEPTPAVTGSGCSCRAVGVSRTEPALLLTLAWALAFAARRRKR